jgi:hypothetical protein
MGTDAVISGVGLEQCDKLTWLDHRRAEDVILALLTAIGESRTIMMPVYPNWFMIPKCSRIFSTF